jgi:methionyl-tRNA formyltransferase
MKRVGFLFDPDNDWIEKFIIPIGEKMEFRKQFKLLFSRFQEDFVDYDIVFILGYTKILPNSFLSRNHLNLVVHESDLPKGKGFAPVHWQILEGRNIIPVCLFEAVEEIDSGDIFLRKEMIFDGSELLPEIREKQAQITKELIVEFLTYYPDFSRVEQVGDSSFFDRRREENSELDINKSIKEQFDFLRIVDNKRYPAFFYMHGNKYYLRISKK